MNRFALSLCFVTLSMASSTLVAADAASTKPPAPRPEFAIVDAFLRECVMARDADGARATAQALGGHASVGAPAGGSFEFDFSGTPAKVTFGPPGLCMLEVPSVDIEPALQAFTIMLERRTVDFLPGFQVVDYRGMDYDDYADDQSRPSLDGEPPRDATVRRWVEAVQAVSSGSLNMRLVVLSKPITAARGAMFLIREIHADAAEIPPPHPPLPPAARHAIETPPSQDISEQLAYPPRFPEAALKSCAHGVVRLHIGLDATGALLDVAVDHSSGNSDLDAAAVDAARHWRFNPGMARGQPVGGELIVPVQFEDPCAATH